ncbi:carbonic anhydrase [Streptomyces sp. NPDC002845]
MSVVGQPQRRAVLTGGLLASAALITGCSSKSDSTGTTEKTAAAAGASTSPSPATAPRPDSPSTAFERLMEGNRRWVDGTLQHPDQDPARREAVADAQHPYAVIVSCIDSRVPPEVVFDTGIGDLFVIRTGGHVMQPVVTGSVEYGPVAEGTPLIVVLGHQSCGAVKASYKAIHDGEKLPGNLQAIQRTLRPAYDAALQQRTDDPVEAMVRSHIRQTAAELRSNKSLAPMVKKGDLAVVSAYYSLDTGEVEIMGGKPS